MSYIITDDDPNEFSCELLDSKNNILAKNVDKYTGDLKFYDRKQYIPLNNLTECVTLRLIDYGNNGGTYFQLNWNGSTIMEKTQNKGFIEKVIVADNCNLCFENETLFELDILTDANPNELSWKLLGSNNEILDSSNATLDTNDQQQYDTKYQDHRQCILSTNSTKCPILQLKDISDAVDTKYVFAWDKTMKEIGTQMNVTEFVKLDCACKSLEMEFKVDNYPCDLSWHLEDSKGSVLISESGFTPKNEKIIIKRCVTVVNNEYVEIRLLDSFGDGGTQYHISWDEGDTIQGVMSSFSFTNEDVSIILGNCKDNDYCPW